jgi:hypothetical protein
MRIHAPICEQPNGECHWVVGILGCRWPLTIIVRWLIIPQIMRNISNSKPNAREFEKIVVNKNKKVNQTNKR